MKIVDAVNFLNIAVRNFAPEVTLAPPSNPVVGQIWTDTTTLGTGATENAIIRYWDGHRWARMDGGGDIPNGMIYDRHINALANIDWAKINHPTNLATTDQITTLQGQITTLSTSVSTLSTTVGSNTTRISTAETNIGALQTDNSSNKSRLTTAEGTISQLQAYNPTEQARVNAALSTKADLVGGKLRTDQLPDLALIRPKVYDSLASRDADNNQTGDVAVVTGVGTYMKAEDGSWIALVVPSGGASVSDLQAEIAARMSADTALGGRIDTEVSNRTSADSSLGSRIDTETSNRTNADAVLDGRITNTISNYGAADTLLQSNIDAEVTARTNAVSAEQTARISGDAANAALVTTEATNRTNADTALGTRIDNEVTARANADLVVRADFATADSSVRTDFAAADSSIRTDFGNADVVLQGQIATKASNTLVVHNTGDESVTGVKTFAASPIVPTPTTNFQTSTKKYVDDTVATEATARANADSGLDSRVVSNTNALTTLNSSATTSYSVAWTAIQQIAAAAGISIAPLVAGKVPQSYLPANPVVTVFTFTNNAALAALTGMVRGDIAIGTAWVDPGDTSSGAGRASFIYDGSAWQELNSPADQTAAEVAAQIAAAIGVEVTNRTNADTALSNLIAALDFGTGGVRSGNSFNVQGTAGRVSVSADNVDIDAGYIGQTSITTLGPVGTGTWNASPITIPKGGTGLVGGSNLNDLKVYLGITALVRPFAQDMGALTPGTPYSVTHGLGTTDITYSIQIKSTGEFVEATVFATGLNTVSVTVYNTYDEGTLRLAVQG